MHFSELGLSRPILDAIADKGYSTPSPIQAQAIPAVIQGEDLMAAAQTGTGKTAGFTLPLLERLSQGTPAKRGRVRGLILTPTRELAAQIDDNVRAYAKNLQIRSTVVFGGVKVNPQIAKLRGGVDILVATPGRLLDLHGQGALNFDQLETLVLDEADRMLDMGFIHDIKKILALLPKQRQNLLFSATFSDQIRKLAQGLVNNPVEISVTPVNSTAETVEQWICPVDKKQKSPLLINLIQQHDWRQVLVFTRTKHGANRLARQLESAKIPAAAIHGNKSQGARTKALKEFKAGQINVLVATDIAARGLDIDQLPQVVNFDLPNVAEDYVHRIGRTGRAGATGQALSLVCADEFDDLAGIERLIGKILRRELIEGFEPVHNLPESDLSKKPARKRSGNKSGNKPGNSNAKQGQKRSQAKKPAGKKPSNAKPGKKPTASKKASSDAAATAANAEHRDGQRSGENARGHKPQGKNRSHRSDAKSGQSAAKKPQNKRRTAQPAKQNASTNSASQPGSAQPSKRRIRKRPDMSQKRG